MRVGEGGWIYEPVEGWGALPPVWSPRGVAAVGSWMQRPQLWPRRATPEGGRSLGKSRGVAAH